MTKKWRRRLRTEFYIAGEAGKVLFLLACTLLALAIIGELFFLPTIK